MVRPDRLTYAMNSYITAHMPDVLQNKPVSFSQLQNYVSSKSLASFVLLPSVADEIGSTKLCQLSANVLEALSNAANVSLSTLVIFLSLHLNPIQLNVLGTLLSG